MHEATNAPIFVEPDAIPSRVLWWLKDPRTELAYAVYRLGNRLERLSGKMHRDLEGAGDHDAENRAWYAMGQRYRARQTVKMLNLAFRAGQQAPQSERPLGEAFELGYGMGRHDVVSDEVLSIFAQLDESRRSALAEYATQLVDEQRQPV